MSDPEWPSRELGARRDRIYPASKLNLHYRPKEFSEERIIRCRGQRRIAADSLAIPVVIPRGADVANHRCDNEWPSCCLQRATEDRAPTSACYLYAVKFISRLSPPTTMGFTCGSIPARVCMHLTPEMANETEGTRRRERQGGQIEHEPVPHLLSSFSGEGGGRARERVEFSSRLASALDRPII